MGKILGIEKNLTRDEFADLFHVQPKTVSVWIRGGKVKAKKIGRSYMIPRSEARKYMNAEVAR